jgi:hypothetical protein
MPRSPFFTLDARVGFDDPLADAELILDVLTADGCVFRLAGRSRKGVDEDLDRGMNAYARSLLDQIDRAVSGIK